MRPLLAIASVAAACWVEPAVGQERCSDILRNGVLGVLSARGREQEQLVELSRLAKSSSSSTDTEGEALGYGSGKQSKAKKDALEDARFRSLFRASESEIAISSGDKTIVDAWLRCLSLARGGPAVWLEAPDKANLKLRLLFLATQELGAPESTTIREDVVLHPSLAVEARGECLKAGAVIDKGGCIVRLRSTNPYVPISLVVSTQKGDLDVYVPPRLRLVARTETRKVPFTVSMPPASNGPIPRSFSVEGDGWFLHPGSARVSYLRSREAVNGGIKCSVQGPPRDGSKHLSVTIWADNNSKNDTGYCDYEVAYEAFRYDVQPID